MNRSSQIASVFLAALAALVATLGYFAPDLRDALFFQPHRARVEAAMLQLAEREGAFRRAKGKFVAFETVNMNALQTLAVNHQTWPSDNFQFDARATPEKGLRIRALPRAEAIQGLEVAAQMFVVELAPSGGVSRSGWYP
jgi:hypothetical protein